MLIDQAIESVGFGMIFFVLEVAREVGVSLKISGGSSASSALHSATATSDSLVNRSMHNTKWHGGDDQGRGKVQQQKQIEQARKQANKQKV